MMLAPLLFSFYWFMILTVCISGLLPAEGPFSYYAYDLYAEQQHYVNVFHSLRQGQLTTLSFNNITRCSTFHGHVSSVKSRTSRFSNKIISVPRIFDIFSALTDVFCNMVCISENKSKPWCFNGRNKKYALPLFASEFSSARI